MTTPSKTEINLWAAFIGEGKAHHTYIAYAMKAMEEGHPEVAQIFMEIAGGETVHGVNHLRLTGEVKSTLENLRKVVLDEGYEMETMYPRMVREAEADGRPDAVASFRLAGDREAYHQVMFQETLDKLERKLAATGEAAATRSTTSVAAAVPPVVAPPAPIAVTRDPAKAHREVEYEKDRIANLTRLREVMFGMQDGLVSTVALVNSVAAATDRSDYVIIAGLTGALAGVFSMAAGSYLGSRAEQDVHSSELEKERREIEQDPAEEIAELIEIYKREGYREDEAYQLAQRIATDRDLWLKVMAEKELGLSVDAAQSPLKDSAVMGVSFFFGGMVPVLPFFLLPVGVAPVVATVLSLASLFALGVGKARLLRRPMLMQGLEVLFIGLLSAVLGMLLGDVLPRLLGVTVGG